MARTKLTFKTDSDMGNPPVGIMHEIKWQPGGVTLIVNNDPPNTIKLTDVEIESIKMSFGDESDNPPYEIINGRVYIHDVSVLVPLSKKQFVTLHHYLMGKPRRHKPHNWVKRRAKIRAGKWGNK
jgi:hypothetical protein